MEIYEEYYSLLNYYELNNKKNSVSSQTFTIEENSKDDTKELLDHNLKLIDKLKSIEYKLKVYSLFNLEPDNTKKSAIEIKKIINQEQDQLNHKLDEILHIEKINDNNKEKLGNLAVSLINSKKHQIYKKDCIENNDDKSILLESFKNTVGFSIIEYDKEKLKNKQLLEKILKYIELNK